jgi:hypothetical protein
MLLLSSINMLDACKYWYRYQIQTQTQTVYIYVIQLDLLYVTGVQRSGFWTTSKQIYLRFLWLSVEVPRSVIYKNNNQWKFVFHQTLQDFLQLWKQSTSNLTSENLCYLYTTIFSELLNSEIGHFCNCSKINKTLTPTSFYISSPRNWSTSIPPMLPIK